MTVILQMKSNSRYMAVEEVIHFKMDRSRFVLKLKEGNSKTYYRKHIRLIRIAEEEGLKDEGL